MNIRMKFLDRYLTIWIFLVNGYWSFINKAMEIFELNIKEILY